MSTANSIITRALREIGVYEAGQVLDADDTQTCLLALNVLVNAWLTAPNYSYTTQKVSATLSSSVTSLTIGPGMSFDCARPVRIEDGAFATIGNIDYQLRQITKAEYLGIALKGLSGPWPGVFYYDAGFPTGNVFFWPTGNCRITLNVLSPLSQFADLNTDYVLPPGYERAFTLTLAEEVAPMYAAQVSPMTMRNAKAARRDIKRANLVIPQLAGDPALHTQNMPIVSTTNYDGVDGNS